MMDSVAVLWIVGALVVVGVIFAIAYVFDQKRAQALLEIAQEMGLQFDKTAEQLPKEIRHDFQLFGKGRGPKHSNLIFGQSNGSGVWIWDFRYSTGGGKNKQTHHQTVCCLSSTELRLPRFNLYRETLLSRIGSGVFGFQDIDFDSHPEFSKMYVLKGDLEDQIRVTFNEQILSFFEGQDKNLCVEGNGDRLLVYRRRRKVKPTLISDYLSECFGIFREFRGSV